ncbi:MAG: 3-oxoacyl-ACP reductase family protein [Bacteroidota bacterium]|nr:3-oxoacyl-ACP reductase family protein [Bacteroidota bacterium]
MINLLNQVVIITGGSRGIGAASAVLFAKVGADVVITYTKNAKAANSVIENVKKQGRTCLAIKADISKSSNANKVIQQTIKKFGRIDILVNNAGIWTYGKIGSMSEKVWKETMQVNLDGMFYLTNAAVPYMKKQQSGKIINISSTAGQRGEAEHSHYAASKGGMISFTKAIATELGQFNINVNSVAPGWVDTDLNDSVFSDKEYKEQERKKIPIQRIPTPEDIAGPIVFLASDLARHITGEILNVNGGSVLIG